MPSACGKPTTDRAGSTPCALRAIGALRQARTMGAFQAAAYGRAALPGRSASTSNTKRDGIKGTKAATGRDGSRSNHCVTSETAGRRRLDCFASRAEDQSSRPQYPCLRNQFGAGLSKGLARSASHTHTIRAWPRLPAMQFWGLCFIFMM